METSSSSVSNNQGASGLNPTLSLTPNAIAKVKDFYSKIPESKGKYFRVYVEGGGCSGMQYGFKFDDKQEGDFLINCAEIQILVDPNSMLYIENSQIDYVESFTGSGFVVQNPKAKASCGCGTSFTV